MALKKKRRVRKEVRAYEKARDRYMDAFWSYEENKSAKHRRAWQEAMRDLLYAYERTSKSRQLNPGIPLDWIPLSHLTSAMRSVIDGKDTDLFNVEPSDRYDSSLNSAKQVAIGYVAKAKTPAETQNRKRRVIDWYGISRSTLNEWIRVMPPYDYDEEIDDNLLSYCIEHYRKNKLIGRRRRQ